MVPCCNEEGPLEWFLPQLATVSGGFSDLEIIVVDDASTDRSAQILESLASRREFRALTNSVNLGFGGGRCGVVSMLPGSTGSLICLRTVRFRPTTCRIFTVPGCLRRHRRPSPIDAGLHALPPQRFPAFIRRG